MGSWVGFVRCRDLRTKCGIVCVMVHDSSSGVHSLP